MSIVEGTYTHGGLTVKYKYRKAIGDRRNLIVIFSGFRDRGTYDFDGGPITSVRGNVLWILDDFSDNFAYYLCTNLDFSVERAIASLIEQAIHYLGITQDQCAVAGFSKGGSAALYYGIKYNYGAILATVPQMHIGSSVKKKWPDVFRSMTKEASSDECEYLDSLLPNLLREDTNLARNVYLFSSESDPQHKTSVEPYLSELGKYDNFNYVLTSSPLVDTHSAVTRYNVPTITSILSLLSEGARPVLGNLLNGSLAPGNGASTLTLAQVCSRDEVIQAFTSLTFQGSVLYPDGFAFVKGYPADEYGKVRTRIRFQSKEMMYEVPTGGVKDPLLSTKFYENQFCDYSVAKFASVAHKGIPLADFPDGKYRLFLDIRHSGRHHVVAARSDRAHNVWSAGEGSLYKIETNESTAMLTKRPALGAVALGAYFRENGRWATGSKVHFEGYFAVQGIPTSDYHHVKYYLVLCSLADGDPVRVFPMASDHRTEANSAFDDPWLDYSKAYYATRKYAGIDLSGTEPGQYRPFITARFGDAVFSEPLDGVLTVSNSYGSLGQVRKPTIGIIGSGVSHDNFNDHLSPGWSSYFTLANESYGITFLSLMSNPVQVSSGRPDSGDAHSTVVTVRDSSKTYMSELLDNPAPDILLVDFFADARFGDLQVEGSFLTANDRKLDESSYWTENQEHQGLDPWDDEAKYLKEFRTAAQEFNILREKHFPNTQIILNSARAVSSYFDKRGRGLFSRSFVNRLNVRWAKLDDVFLQCVPAEVISAATKTTYGDPSHPRGLAPYHYERDYYVQFRETLLMLLGIEVKVSLD